MSKVFPAQPARTFCIRNALAMAAAVAALSVVLPAEAAAYSKKVENACRSDYDRHCPGYKEGSPALRNCMTLAGKRGNLSRTCFNALVDAGLVPRKYLKRR